MFALTIASCLYVFSRLENTEFWIAVVNCAKILLLQKGVIQSQWVWLCLFAGKGFLDHKTNNWMFYPPFNHELRHEPQTYPIVPLMMMIIVIHRNNSIPYYKVNSGRALKVSANWIVSSMLFQVPTSRVKSPLRQCTAPHHSLISEWLAHSPSIHSVRIIAICDILSVFVLHLEWNNGS